MDQTEAYNLLSRHGWAYVIRDLKRALKRIHHDTVTYPVAVRRCRKNGHIWNKNLYPSCIYCYIDKGDFEASQKKKVLIHNSDYQPLDINTLSDVELRDIARERLVTSILKYEEEFKMSSEQFLDGIKDGSIQISRDNKIWNTILIRAEGLSNSLEIDLAKARRMKRIEAYETAYGMSSDEFLNLWDRGLVEDSFDTNHWFSLLNR